MPDIMADRRDAPRYPLIVMAEITLLPAGTKMTARTLDVSRTGCYVDTRNPSAKGEQIRVRLIQRGESFECEALVVYVSPGLGMGVRFTEPVPPGQVGDAETLAGASGEEILRGCRRPAQLGLRPGCGILDAELFDVGFEARRVVIEFF